MFLTGNILDASEYHFAIGKKALYCRNSKRQEINSRIDK